MIKKRVSFSVFVISIILVSFLSAILLYVYSEYQARKFLRHKEDVNILLFKFESLINSTNVLLITDDIKTVQNDWEGSIRDFNTSLEKVLRSDFSYKMMSRSEAFKKKTDDIFDFWKMLDDKIRYVRTDLNKYMASYGDNAPEEKKGLMVMLGYQMGMAEPDPDYMSLYVLIDDVQYVLSTAHIYFSNMLNEYRYMLSDMLDRKIYKIRAVVLVLSLAVIFIAVFSILQNQKILRRTATQYKTLFEGANDTIFILKRDMFQECNAVTEEMFGASKEQIVGHSIIYFSPRYQVDGRDSAESLLKKIDDTLEGMPQKFEWRFKRIDGSEFDAEVSLNRVYLFPEVFIQAFIRDITEQKRAINALIRSEKKYRDLVENMEDVIFTLDNTGIVLTVNKAIEDVLGVEPDDVIGTRFVEWVLDENREKAMEDFKEIMSGERNRGILHLVGNQGNGRVTEYTANAIIRDFEVTGVKGILRDITEKKKSEEELRSAYEQLKTTQAQLIQSEKMAGVGQLAAGIAHEINNPTGFVISNLETLEYYSLNLFKIIFAYEELIKKNLPDDAQKAKILLDAVHKIKTDSNLDYMKNDIPSLTSEVLEGANRIKNIVLNLRTFAHPDKEKFEVADVNLEIEKAFALVWNELKYKCEITKNYGELSKIECNPGQLVQVFVNLLINASQAIEESGKIDVTTYERDDYIYLEFSDNGKGIPKENMQSIFEPFFTTKPVGEGTGLGLSIVYKIIQTHKGFIDVESEPGNGAKFIIRLPVKA